MKKEYIKPTTRAFQIQAQTILAGSGVRSVWVNDVEQNFTYSNTEDDDKMIYFNAYEVVSE